MEMRSTAGEGHASVLLEFDAGFDSDKALQDVREKVDKAKAKLPGETDEPTVNEVKMSRFDPMLVRFLFGRGQDCDQTIDHPTISREHAEILFRNGQFLLRDFSTNGSIVVQGDNIEQIHRSSIELKGEGQIYLGRTHDQQDYCIEFTCTDRR